MQEITDETLSAYLDHELDAPRRADVEAEIALNPALARRLAALRETDALTREAFSEISACDVPESLVQAVSGSAAGTRTTGRGWFAVPRRLLPETPGATMTIGLIAGIVLSLLLPRLLGGGGADSPATVAPMQPAATLAKALNTTPSNKLFSSGDLTVVPISTFRTETGRICRQYRARTGAQGATMAGIACRSGHSGWHNEVMVSLGGSRDGGYTPATAADDLKALRPQWRQATVLSRNEERALLQRWNTQDF